MRRTAVAAAVLLLAGCGGHAVPAAVDRPVAVPSPPVSTSSAAPAFSAGVAIADPPRRPRPKQPVDAATATADAATARSMGALLTACGARGWTLCAALGRHYLGATGAPVEIDVTAMLAGLPTFAALVRRHQGGVSGWMAYDCPSGTDWGYALGHVGVRVVGNRVEVADVYDFDPGTPFAAFGSLADHGRAADFLVTGVAPAKV